MGCQSRVDDTHGDSPSGISYCLDCRQELRVPAEDVRHEVGRTTEGSCQHPHARRVEAEGDTAYPAGDAACYRGDHGLPRRLAVGKHTFASSRTSL